MKYNIISTGSKGNAVIIGDVLIDIGVPYSKLHEYLYDIKIIFITHKHSDHLNLTTFKKIKKNFPHIKILSNYDVAESVGFDQLFKVTPDDYTVSMGEYQLTTFNCLHDVICQGLVIKINDLNIIYATDTSTLENAPGLKYDSCFIESNHDEQKMKVMISNSKKKYGYDVFLSSQRHLSTQKAKAFYYMYRRNKESKFIELHQSERFY